MPPVRPVNQVVYKFFWGGMEYQLMVFVGDPNDWEEEELIEVYTAEPYSSQAQAHLDVMADVASRQCLQYTVEVDLIAY